MKGHEVFFFLNTVNALYSTKYQLEKKHEAANNQNYQFWKIRIFYTQTRCFKLAGVTARIPTESGNIRQRK